MSTSALKRNAPAEPGSAVSVPPSTDKDGRRAAAFDALPEAVAIIDESGIIADVNSAWTTFAALNKGDPERTGVSADYFATCKQAAAAGDLDAAVVAEGLDGVLVGRLRSFEHLYPCPSLLEDRWFIVRITPLSGRAGALVSHLDVTTAKLTSDRLAHQATHDPLTGLPNRAALLRLLRTSISRLNRTGTPVAVLFLDLDGFKPINDRYGHEVGDRFLVKVANRLQRQLRASDVVGRVGGDEFVALCDAADADALAARLRAAVATPVQVGNDCVSVTVSVGVAIAKEAAAQDTEAVARALLAQADKAMYAAKRARPPSAP